MFKNKGDKKKLKIFVYVLITIFLLSFLIWQINNKNTLNEITSVEVEGMSIENFYIENEIDILTTTGGIFRINSKNGTIDIWQRIGKKRLLAKIVLDKDWFESLTELTRDEFYYTWKGQAPNNSEMIISGDSVISFLNIKKTEIKLEFSPAYQKINNANNGLLALDNDGGLVIAPNVFPHDEILPKISKDNIWKLSTHESLPLLFVGICPSRQFDWNSSFSHNIHYSSHIQRYPTNEEIITYSEYAKVLELHSWIWQNRHEKDSTNEKGEKIPLWRDYSSRPQNFKWIPEDEKELKRVIKTAQAHDMKVIPYVNFAWKDFDTTILESSMSIDEIFEIHMTEMQRLKNTYNFDGLYLDGLYYTYPQKNELSYRIAKALRKLFGEEGWLTYHNTHSGGYYLPFIDAYMDLIITSEHESFDRWKSTSYNISNAIASVWPEIPIDVKDGRKFLKKLIDDSLIYNNRVILMAGEQGQWREWRLYFTKDEIEFMQKYYFEQLKKLNKFEYGK